MSWLTANRAILQPLEYEGIRWEGASDVSATVSMHAGPAYSVVVHSVRRATDELTLWRRADWALTGHARLRVPEHPRDESFAVPLDKCFNFADKEF